MSQMNGPLDRHSLFVCCIEGMVTRSDYTNSCGHFFCLECNGYDFSINAFSFFEHTVFSFGENIIRAAGVEFFCAWNLQYRRRKAILLFAYKDSIAGAYRHPYKHGKGI
jgi:hypothetical protein